MTRRRRVLMEDNLKHREAPFIFLCFQLVNRNLTPGIRAPLGGRSWTGNALSG
jgi:hypothetical protein